MQNQCYLNARSICILNALRIRKGVAFMFPLFLIDLDKKYKTEIEKDKK